MSGFSLDGGKATVHYEGSFISVQSVGYRDPEGQAHQRDIVRHPGAVVIVPYVEETGSVLFIEQYRVAIDRALIELPAGKRDIDGESPEECARRELEEEIGVKSQSMVFLAKFFNSPGFTDEETYVFLARGLSSGEHNPQGVEEASARRRSARLAGLEDLVSTGTLNDAKSIIGMYAARSYLENLNIPETFDDDIDLDGFAPVEPG